jgi:hypothetical protein
MIKILTKIKFFFGVFCILCIVFKLFTVIVFLKIYIASKNLENALKLIYEGHFFNKKSIFIEAFITKIYNRKIHSKVDFLFIKTIIFLFFD